MLNSFGIIPIHEGNLSFKISLLTLKIYTMIEWLNNGCDGAVAVFRACLKLVAASN
jgi:hypothetical protein